MSLTVPVDTWIRLLYREPASLTFNQTITAPVNSVLNTRLNLDKDVKAPILASFGLLFPSQTPVPVRVQYAELSLRLQRAWATINVKEIVCEQG